MTPEQRPEVVQVDREAAARNILARLIQAHSYEQPWMDASTTALRMGGQDDHYEVQAFAAHRIAAEKAALERAARIVDAEAELRRLHLSQAKAAKKKTEARDFETMVIAHVQGAAAIRAVASHPERRSENG